MGINELLNIGSKMKKIRIANEIPQKEMAKSLNLSVSTYSNYENGHREPPEDIIRNFCNELNISLADLLGITHKSQQALGILENLRNESRNFLESMENTLLDNFNCLNLEGKEKALEQVNLLTKVPEYRKDTE